MFPTFPSSSLPPPIPSLTPSSVPLSPSRPSQIAARLAAEASARPLDDVFHPHRLNSASAGARALAMYLAHVGLGVSMSVVARDFGRHRSTVAHACRKIEERREVAGWDRWVERLENDARALLACESHVPEVRHG